MGEIGMYDALVNIAILIGVMGVVLIVFMYLKNRNKKKQNEAIAKLWSPKE